MVDEQHTVEMVDLVLDAASTRVATVLRRGSGAVMMGNRAIEANFLLIGMR